MCDEKERAEISEGRAGGRGTRMFDQCAPMIERMFRQYRESPGEPAEGSPAQAAGATESAPPTGNAVSDLDSRERELVALGAAMGSNCVPCIEYHVPEARKAGLTDAQIREAIRLADRIRKVPARKVLSTALELLSEDAAGAADGPEAPPPSGGARPTAADGSCCG